ncbi:MAG: VWA domain-containing protein, partial [Acidobacteria bacterium]|nr:VWA domain-containing protein [Acidobacteriota bacterium]
MFRSISVALLLGLSTAVLAGQQASVPPPSGGQRPDPQMPPITFRAEVNYVEVDAVVVDAGGTFVRDLTQADFQVFEDGKAQAVSAFSLIDIPIERAERPLFSPRDIEPDVQTNLRNPDGRLYVLLLDDIHTDAMRSTQVRRAARQFVERNLGSNDLAAVIYTSGRTDAAQDFTINRRLLAEAIDKFMGRKLRSAFLNKLDNYNMSIQSGQSGALMDPDQAHRLYNARAMLSTVRNLSDWLASIHGRRKAVVLISEGIDYDIWDTIGPSELDPNRRGDASILIDETRDVIAAATRANVNIYAVDPRGLYQGGEDAIQIGSYPADANSVGLGLTSLQDEVRLSQDSLRTLAGDTGGFASVSSNDFSGAFQRIVDENSSYYVLGYYSNNEKRDGRFRKIEVRLARPGLQVKARKGYVAPRGGKPAVDKNVEASAGTSKDLRDALNSPLQVGGLKMALLAAPLKGPASKATVAIVTQVLASDMAFTQKGGKFVSTLEVSYLAIGRDGKVAAANRDSINLALKPETYQRVMQAGFRVQSRLDVPPGSYQLRVAAREGGGRTGSVFYDLTVPDFSKEPLVISGLILTSAAASGVPTAGSIPEIQGGLPGPVTTARTFNVSDEIALLAEIYDNQARAQAHSVYISTVLKAEGGKSVFTTDEQRSSKELGGAKGGYGYTTRVPLKDLDPGLYVLRVEARTSLGDKNT